MSIFRDAFVNNFQESWRTHRSYRWANRFSFCL